MRLLRNRFVKRTLAAWLLLSIFTDLLFPTVALALTAGPTAPEATSFEPIDTTDMVNLQSGDFTYNIPLLEVPGPEGGYPLSLSYHAGIQPNEEASWVGLGWTLNPGAINRNVNGYADDQRSLPFDANLDNDVTVSRRDYWEGGDQETYKIGVSVGIANTPATVSAGLSFSQDTYQGFGVGGYIGIGGSYGLGKESPFSIGAGLTVGVDGYGNEYASAYVGIGAATKGAVSAGGFIGLSTNFNTVSGFASGGASYNSHPGDRGKNIRTSLLGVSMSTDGGKPSLSVGGFGANVQNASAGKISTQSSGFGVDIPTPVPGLNISLGYNYTRYWSDETSETKVSGMLYYPNQPGAVLNNGELDNVAYDTYSLLDAQLGIVDNPESDMVMGGSFPECDNYNVTGQGLGGSIRPYLFRKKLYRQNRKNNEGDRIVHQAEYRGADFTDKAHFRFINDFSNKHLYNFDPLTSLSFGASYAYNPNPSNPYESGDPARRPLIESFSGSPAAGFFSNNKLAGSRHIDWYTNGEIANNTARNEGFMDTQAAGFVRRTETQNSMNTQIGGFKITNESGVTYHYALPVYTGNEIIYTETIKRNPDDANKPDGFTQISKPAQYAYTWYLTAVTGPDFVDRGTIGVFDEQDWGYWVSFEYGKWANSYAWQNPAAGFNKDIDNNFQSYSKGRKEIYYLNIIKTRTHVAIFEKSERIDAKDVPFITGGVASNYTTSMKLDEIFLIRADNYDSYLAQMGIHKEVKRGFFENLIDNKDVDAVREVLTSKAIRIVQLNHDYSLCRGVSNADFMNELVGAGKLTLKSLKFLGKQGADLTPPMNFEYDLPETSENNTQLNVITSGGVTTIWYAQGRRLEKGDILRYIANGKTNYANVKDVLISNDGFGTTTYKLTLFPGSTLPAGVLNGYQTKNPPYNKDTYDMWGLYKSDYEKVMVNINGTMQENENLSRYPTRASVRNTDVWSLRKIITPTGASITVGYESDDYSNAVLAQNYTLRIKNVANSGNNRLKISFYETSYELSSIFNLEGKANIQFWGAYDNKGTSCSKPFPIPMCSDFSSFPIPRPQIVNFKSSSSIVKNINNAAKEIIIEDPTLYTQFNTGIEVEDVLYTLSGTGMSSFVRCCTKFVGAPNFMIGGQTSSPNNQSNIYGGGLRVAFIGIDNDGTMRRTNYRYNKNGGLSSGATSFEPFGMLEPILTFPQRVSSSQKELLIKDAKKDLYAKYSSLLANAREVPPPGVTYEYVTVEEYVQNAGESQPRKTAGKITYQFEVFKEGMIDIDTRPPRTLWSSNDSRSALGFEYKQAITRNVAVKNFTTRVGNLKRVIQYDEQGNKITEKISHYLHDEIGDRAFDNRDKYENLVNQRFNGQGVIQEMFADSRFVRQPDGYYNLLGVMSQRAEYPSILTGSTSINYKTGLTQKDENLAFDFYSGALIKSVATDEYGNRYLSETTPAYKMYPEMGPRVTASGIVVGNKNMLTQTAGSYLYQVDAANNPIGLVNASVQTWSDQVNVITYPSLSAIQQRHIWRKQAAYTFTPLGIGTQNGIIPMSEGAYAKTFDFTQPPNGDSRWRKDGEITRYDVYSKALEGSDVNGNYITTRMGYDNKLVVATGGPARYYQLAYSGAETLPDPTTGWLETGVLPNDGIRATGVFHTGVASLKVGGGRRGFSYGINSDDLADNGKTYRASVWVKGSGSGMPQVKLASNGTDVSIPSVERKAGNWYLLKIDIDATNLSGLTVYCQNTGSGDVYFDDFRMQPLVAGMTTYVYDPAAYELTHILDNNNLYTRYEYDGVGRLRKVYREFMDKPGKTGGERLLTETRYNYARK
jgi:hypothetical protein